MTTIDDLIEDTIDPRQDQLEPDPDRARIRRFISALAPALAEAGVEISLEHVPVHGVSCNPPPPLGSVFTLECVRVKLVRS